MYSTKKILHIDYKKRIAACEHQLEKLNNEYMNHEVTRLELAREIYDTHNEIAFDDEELLNLLSIEKEHKEIIDRKKMIAEWKKNSFIDAKKAGEILFGHPSMSKVLQSYTEKISYLISTYDFEAHLNNLDQ